jgi:hypothetical protein
MMQPTVHQLSSRDTEKFLAVITTWFTPLCTLLSNTYW